MPTQWAGAVGIVDEEPVVSVARCRLTMVVTDGKPLPDR